MTPAIAAGGVAPCGHPAASAARVAAAARRLAPGAIVRPLQAPGLPPNAIVVDGRPLAADAVATAPCGCALYEGAPVPPQWLVEAALLAAMRPANILFLCVANSARSQMAEGLARSLAPAGVTVASAGSAPSQVRPQAIEVLREIGIDISNHRSKPVSEIEARAVDAVVTLCAEEVCPLFLGPAAKVHWGLPDPAAVEGDWPAQLQAFRSVRDELRHRLEALFQRWS